MGKPFCRIARRAVMGGVAVLAALHASATPPCAEGTLTARTERTANYMPFSDRGETVNIRIDSAADSACQIVLKLSSGTGGDFLQSKGRLDIEVRTRQGHRLITDGNDPFTLTLLPVSAKGVSADLIATIPPRQTVAPGLYEGVFELETVARNGGDQSASFILAALVASQADIRLAGKSGRASGRGIDFGVLESGREETSFVSVRSNGAYTVELASKNGWFLELAGPDNAKARIAYATWFNNFSVPSQPVVRIPEIYEPTGPKGKLNRLRFRMGDTRDKPAGLYQDTVSLTVILLE